MKINLAITALSACALIGSAAIAERPHGNHNRHSRTEGSAAVGGAVAGPNGAGAVGGAGSGSTERSSGTGRQAMTNQRCTPATSATNLGAAAYTNRNTGSAAVNTSGTARGTSSASSSSQGGASASTDPDFGSTADASGRSTANGASRPC